MQHADVLSGHDMNEFTRLDVPDFNEVRLKRKNVRVGEGKGVGVTLP